MPDAQVTRPDGETPDPARDAKRIWDAAESLKTAMLVTQGAQGLHARPMHAIIAREEALIWFLTDSGGAKDDEIEADSDVAVTFSNAGQLHLAITGRASIVDDRATVKGLWSPAAKAFYPQGPEDPDIVAIKVRPKVAELWDGPVKLVALAKMAAAVATGSSAADMGDQIRVSFA